MFVNTVGFLKIYEGTASQPAPVEIQKVHLAAK